MASLDNYKFIKMNKLYMLRIRLNFVRFSSGKYLRRNEGFHPIIDLGIVFVWILIDDNRDINIFFTDNLYVYRLVYEIRNPV